MELKLLEIIQKVDIKTSFGGTEKRGEGRKSVKEFRLFPT